MPDPGPFWQSPALHAETERKASWLELFFDLFFVVAVAQVAHEVLAHPTMTGLLTTAALFAPVWWVWVGATVYAERFETAGVETRLYTFGLMLAVVGMAASAHAAS